MSLHTIYWSVRRALGLSPTQAIFRELAKRGVPIGELRSLELFAGTGIIHSKDYLPLVQSLQAWELDPACEAPLRRNLPGATVKITDSYQEIQKTSEKFNLIVVDSPDCVHGDQGQYCENFQILPEVFRVMEDDTVLLVSVKVGHPKGKPWSRDPFTEAGLEKRRQFYGTDHPESISLEEMLPVYRKLIESKGFELEWYLSRQRTLDGRAHYLVMKVHRRGTRSNNP